MTITIQSPFHLTFEQTALLEKTAAYEAASLSKNTLRTYRSMCGKFQAWCEGENLSFLPASAETIAIYLCDMGGTVSFSTIDSTIAAIESAHEKAGRAILGDQSIYRRVRKGIRRIHKGNQTLKQATPLTVADLKAVCQKLGDSLKDCRDKALLLLIFFGALRRSEAVALNIGHLAFSDKGLAVSILQSKTSDIAEVVYIACAKNKNICAVHAIEVWIEKMKVMTAEVKEDELKEKPVFLSLLKGGKLAGRLSGHAVCEIIKQHFGSEYSGHSGRRGLITASAEKGTPMHVIKKHSRHKSADMVLRYIEEAKGFEDSAVSILGV
jgi:integrase